MLHLSPVAGEPGYKGDAFVINNAICDIQALQNGGIDGVLIENWHEDSIGEFIQTETRCSIDKVIETIKKYIKVPYGINILNNDYKTAFLLAKKHQASFVQLDVFVDQVISDFSYSVKAKNSRFVINPKPKTIWDFAHAIGADDKPLIVFVQPKHYQLCDIHKTLEKSVLEAAENKASGVIVTQKTGIAPFLYKIKQAKKAAGCTPVGVGSGVNVQNISQIAPSVDFVIVGTALKQNGDINNPVDIQRVGELVAKLSKYRLEFMPT